MKGKLGPHPVLALELAMLALDLSFEQGEPYAPHAKCQNPRHSWPGL